MPKAVRSQRAIVVGAGMGGLVAALELAVQGLEVTVLERAATPGGKMREIEVAGRRLDAGPTVLTMRWVLEEIFAAAGTSLDRHLVLHPAATLARHAWSDRELLDLHADIDRSADAIAAFAGPAEGRRYRSFCEQARATYTTLEGPFIRAARPSLQGLVGGVGLGRLGRLWQIKPFSTLWQALGEHFHDPRLRQLFGRYATYCGSSPFLAPATLMLVAHVEQEGVWLVEGGMHRLAATLAGLAAGHGAVFRYGTEASEIVTARGQATGVRLADGELLEADAVVVNADVAAVAGGLLGSAVTGAVPATPHSARSLSAVTWTLLAEVRGFPLLRHTVFFSRNYGAEFADILQHRTLPRDPTVYVCAQDRSDRDEPAPPGPERILCLVNAPPDGDSHLYGAEEIQLCATRTWRCLERCGLDLRSDPATTVVTTPSDFARLFPGTSGALYGQASHGWKASFERPAARSRIPRLYLAGGSTHPGPGVPMAALSGRMAAASLLSDLTSTSRSPGTAMRGGTLTR
ncbi:MAG: phytoene desaturase [Geminicoccaceae bacterium]|nr:phytoene desaturase [Geminicoccaceae bacterium]